MCRRHGIIAQNTQFFTEVLGGIEQCCRDYGMELMVTNINDVGHPSAEISSRIMSSQAGAMRGYRSVWHGDGRRRSGDVSPVRFAACGA
jgi:hypothetical protein